MLKKLKEQSIGNTLICPLGIGSATSMNTNSSFLVVSNGTSLLIDIGVNVPQKLESLNIELDEIDYFYLTHSHADHVGGLSYILLYYKYESERKPNIIIPKQFKEELWSKTILNEFKIEDYVNIINPIETKIINNLNTYYCKVENLELNIFQTYHCPAVYKVPSKEDWEKAMWATGLKVNNIYISGDTVFNHQALKVFADSSKYIFHDCQLYTAKKNVHTPYKELLTMFPKWKEKTYLYHYGDDTKNYEPKNDGFLGFAKELEIYQ